MVGIQVSSDFLAQEARKREARASRFESEAAKQDVPLPSRRIAWVRA